MSNSRKLWAFSDGPATYLDAGDLPGSAKLEGVRRQRLSPLVLQLQGGCPLCNAATPANNQAQPLRSG